MKGGSGIWGLNRSDACFQALSLLWVADFLHLVNRPDLISTFSEGSRGFFSCAVSKILPNDICFQILLFGLTYVSFFFFNKFIYFWLCWVFVSVQGLSPVAASGGHSSSRCAGLSLLRPLPLRSTGSRRAGSVVVAHGPSCSAACRIFPDRGMNPCPLHWQADS